MAHSPEQAYSELIRRIREASLLASCGSVLGWDEATYMPRGGSAFRGEQMALIARLTHEMTTASVIGELLTIVESSALLSEPYSDAAANVREIRRSYDRAVRVPADLVAELARVSTLAQQTWREARKKSDFALFRPHLETLVRLLRDKADALGHQGIRYDALFDEYEPGASTTQTTEVFAGLQRELIPLLSAIRDSGKTPDRSLLEREYPVERQKLLAESAAAAIGFDFDAGRLDESTHPFCSAFGPGDCRLTTRYNPRRFNDGFFGVLHEAGHGLYEQGLPAEHVGTPIGTYCSLGIHESQSRLWENQVGRSAPFWEHFFPRVRQAFPQALREVTLENWLFAINDVHPSHTRVEADEVTYNLHIVLRFELEQAIIAGDLAVADIPGAWNERFERLLGLKVENDAQGCLQDIHWSFGGMGYFATYTLGNLYAAQFMEAARSQLSGLEHDFRRGHFDRLRLWLTEHIHRSGQRRRAGELCQQVTGKSLDSQPFLRYLRDKFRPLYGL